MGVALSDGQVESLLAGKKTLLKGLTSKAGKKYDAYIIPSGTEEYHYTKDGEEKSGVQFKFVMKFPNKKFTGKSMNCSVVTGQRNVPSRKRKKEITVMSVFQ